MRKITALFIFIIVTFFTTKSNAQVCGYSFSQGIGTYTPISGGTYLYGNSAGNSYWDDGISQNHPIGFNFNFAGTTFDRFSLNPNGYITMGTSIVYDLYNVLCGGRGSGRNNVISALTTDLYASSGCGRSGAIQYLTTGTAPNRVLTVQWGDVGVYGWGSSFCINFQIKLHETTNKVEIVYGTFNVSTSATREFQVGIAGSSECDFLIRQVSSTGSWASSTAGLTACASCYASNSITPASGLTYTFDYGTATCASCCPPSNTVASNITGGSATISWTASTSNPSSGYEYEVRTSGAGGSGTTGLVASGSVAAGVTSVAISGLSPSTTYTVYVRANCGNGNYSIYPGGATFTTTSCNSAGTLSGTQSVCVGSTTSFTTSGGGGTWTSSNTAVATVSSSGVVTGIAAGSATITYSVAAAGTCTASSATRSVTVSTAPVAGTLSGNQNICTGNTTTFVSSASGGTWSTSNSSIATVSSAGVVTGVGVGTATITYTVAGVGCADATATRTVSVSAGPVAGTLSGTQAICQQSTTTFTSSASGGTWSSSNTAVATVSSSGIVTGVSAGTATITYTVAGTGDCPNATATRTVTVTALTTAGSFSGNTNVFIGATSTLSSSVSGGVWSSSNNTVATIGSSTGLVSGLAAGTSTITYTVTGTGGCADASGTTTVTVGGCPTIPALSSSAYPVCAESNFTLTAAGMTNLASFSTGITFKYSTTVLTDPYVGGTVIATIPSSSLEAGSTVARTTTSIATGGTYYIYAILSPVPGGNGCRPFATTTLVVNPKGQVTLPANSVVCHGTSISAQTLSTTNSGGTTTYAWTNSATSIGLAASGSTATIPAFTATNTGSAGVTATIGVTPTYTDGGLSCPGATSSYTITVNPVPALSAVANQVICNASTGAVSFNSTTNPAQTLSVSSGAISVTIPDGNAAGITNALTATIPTGATITGIAVNFNITHTWNSDMIINLVAPNGQILNLVNGRGGSSDNFTNTTISSASTTSLATGTAPFTGTFAADASSGVGPTSFLSNAANFAALYSGTTSGSWRLALRDRFTGDVGTLTSWSITFTYTPVPSVTWTNSNTAIGLAASGTGNISFTATNPGPDQISSTITATPTYDNAGLSCSGTPITFTIAVNPSGQVNTVSNQVLCNTSATSAVTFSTTNNGLISTGGTQTESSGTISVTVPDASAVGTTHTIPVSLPTGAVISNMRVTLNMTHTWISDMVINLKAPNGQVLNLFNQHGGAGDNLVNTVVSSTGTTAFTSGSAPFTGTFAATAASGQGPTGYTSNAANFAALYSTPSGNWVLALRDLAGGDIGVLTSWSISIDYTVQGTFGTNMNWTNSNATIGLAATGTGNIPSFTAVNNGGTPIVSTVTVTPSYFNGGTSCAGTPTTFTYTVNPTPTVNAVAGQVFCAGTPSTVNFSGIAAGTVYSWTNSNTAIGLAASGTGNLSFTPTNTGTTPIIATITVTPSYTNAGVTCTGTPRTFTITVNPVGQVNAVTSQVLCNGSNTTAVNFATVNGGGTIVAGTPVVANSGTIAVVVPDANAGGASHAIPVTVPAGATITGVSVNFNMSHTWVSDMVFNLKAPNGQILNLVNRRGGAGVNFTNTTISSAGTASLATALAPFTGTFAADAAIGVGPTGQLSTAANFAALYSVGSGDWTLQMRDYVGGDIGTLTSWSITINYTTLVPAVTSYAWTNNLSSIGLAASGTGNIASFAATNTTAAPVTATVTVTPTYTNAGTGCAGTPISYTYTVNPTPTVNAVANQTVCRGSNVAAVTFTGATTGTVYNWTNSNTAIGLAASGTGDIASFVGTNTTAAPISGTITVTPVYTNAGVTCTGTPRTFTVTVNPIPTVNPVANFAACHNTTAAAAFSGATTGTVFNWTNSNPAIGLPASGSGNISFTALNTTSAPVTATITVTPSFTNAGTTCVGTPTSFVITVNPLPVVTTGTLPGRICISDTLVRLNGTPVGGSWSGFGISGFNFMPPATDVGTWPITYTYADANGCVNSASTTVTVLACEERNRDLDNGAVILYPNPNSGQFNLRVNSTRFNVLGMKVYNTAGQLVYVNQWRGLVFARVIPVNLNNLAAGTYMVRLYYGDGMDRGADKTYQVVIAR
jgi:subtilisin-like proprotein convertase family protein